MGLKPDHQQFSGFILRQLVLKMIVIWYSSGGHLCFLWSWKFGIFEILKNLKFDRCHARIAVTLKFRKFWAQKSMFCMTPKTRNFGRKGRFRAPRCIFPALPGAARYALASLSHGAKHSPLLKILVWPKVGSRGSATDPYFFGIQHQIWSSNC